MVSIAETTRIDAPVADVFAYMDDPQNHVEVTPSLADVRNVEPLDNGGKQLEHTFRMAGVGLDGELVETTHEEGEVMVFEMSGGLEGELQLEYDQVDDGTELTYTASYDLPGSVLATVAEPFVRRYNERELRTTLENIKTRLEVGDGSETD